MASKQPARDFLDFVNASPTRKCYPSYQLGEIRLTQFSLPRCEISQGPSGPGWIPGNQGTYSIVLSGVFPAISKSELILTVPTGERLVGQDMPARG